MRPDEIVIVDWSGGNDRGPRPKRDAIWIGAVAEAPEPPVYCRSRAVAEDWLTKRIEAILARGRLGLIGFDFAFGYPAGFSRAVTGSDDPFRLWQFLSERIEDGPGANNRFDVAAGLNRLFPGVGPFWGNPLARDIPDLPRRGRARDFVWPTPRRACERQTPGAFEVWQLAGAGAVGSQVLMGLPVLWRLRARFAPHVAVWPFEPPGPGVTFVEVFPSLIAGAIAAWAPDETIRDRAQVGGLARALAGLDSAQLAVMLGARQVPPAREEGWILGAGHAADLGAALT